MRFTSIHRQLGLQPQVLTRLMIDDAVAAQLPEQGDLDWKQIRYESKTEWREEFAKDVAAMANSGGGLIVLGVEEDRPTARAVSVNPVEAMTDGDVRTYRQVAFNAVTPPVAGLDFANLTADDGSTVVAIWVPPSVDAPHLIYRQTYFGAPFRDGTRTEWMREQQLQAAYRRRFDQRGDRSARLDDLYFEMIARSLADRRVCFVAAAVPDSPRPPALGRVDVHVTQPILDNAITLRAKMVMPNQLSPLTDNSGQLSQFRTGPRCVTARYSHEDGSKPQYRSAEASIHDDGSVSMWWSIGGALQREVGGSNETLSLYVEHAMADFVALSVGTMRTLGIDSSVELRAGLAFIPGRAIIIRRPDPNLAGYDADVSEESVARHFVPARATLPAQPTDADAMTAACEMALDCVSQGGATLLHRLRWPNADS
jgi:hypothetical protein